jgi:general secretion pathway protein G
MRRARPSSGGYSFIELVVATAIMMVLASAAPLARVSIKRHKEAELHYSLREMRLAIDAYHDAVVSNVIGGINVSTTSEGYPPDLETLVNGVVRANDPSGKKIKFLRRIPTDPMTGSSDWGLQAHADSWTPPPGAEMSTMSIRRPKASDSTGRAGLVAICAHESFTAPRDDARVRLHLIERSSSCPSS